MKEETVVLTYLGNKWSHDWYINEETESVYMKIANESYIIIDKSVNKEDLINELLEGELEKKVQTK